MHNSVLKLSHNPRLRPRTGPSVYDVLKFGFFLFGLPANGFISVDATSRCNLRCKHCYFFEQDCADQEEWSTEQWVEFFEERKRDEPRWKFPFLQCTWVGGEPLIRADLIERCKSFFRYNTVVTNGSIPLPNWSNVHFYVSVDGTEQYHDEIRNKQGLYERAKKIANRPELDITVACCITKDNWESIEELIKEWNAIDGVGHITFDFYTPIESIEHPFWLGWELRDHVVDILLELKRIYGDFIITPERAFRLMKSNVSARVTSRCLFSAKSTAFGPRGETKAKCMIGPKADCERCGCVVPFYLHSLVDKGFIVRDTLHEVRSGIDRARRRFLPAG